MKPFLTFLVFSMISLPAVSLFHKNYKWIDESQIENLIVRYDPQVLRIPGNKYQ